MPAPNLLTMKLRRGYPSHALSAFQDAAGRSLCSRSRRPRDAHREEECRPTWALPKGPCLPEGGRGFAGEAPSYPLDGNRSDVG